MNYKRLGEPRKARLAVGLSVLAMAILCTIGYLLPVPTSLISIGGTHHLADELSRRAFAGEAVDTWLTDDMLSPQAKLLWSDRPRAPAPAQDETPDRP